MAIGAISSVGLLPQDKIYTDVDYTLLAETSGTSNWVASPSSGTNCYIQEVNAASISSAITETSDITLINKAAVTETNLANFAKINACEVVEISNVLKVVFYAMNGDPGVDIPLTIRIENER